MNDERELTQEELLAATSRAALSEIGGEVETLREAFLALGARVEDDAPCDEERLIHRLQSELLAVSLPNNATELLSPARQPRLSGQGGWRRAAWTAVASAAALSALAFAAYLGWGGIPSPMIAKNPPRAKTKISPRSNVSEAVNLARHRELTWDDRLDLEIAAAQSLLSALESNDVDGELVGLADQLDSMSSEWKGESL
jgi:hypothetical protein